jgi:DNA mismatch repair protein MutS
MGKIIKMPMPDKRRFTASNQSPPFLKKYCKIKKRYTDTILFYRMGDFYEIFLDDAVTASKVLGIPMTSKNKLPMCGVPYHVASKYLNKMLHAGQKVALCEVIVDRSVDFIDYAGGKREVIRIVRPRP